MEAAEEETKHDTVERDMSICRSAVLEETVDFTNIENITVFDENGAPVRVGDIYKHQKTILILVRHFLCYVCKEYVDDLGLIPEKYLQEANVQLVVIGCAKWKFIKPFREATGYQQKLFVDPDRHLYKALKCTDSMNLSQIKESKHIKSGLLSGISQSIWRGMKFCELQGDISQQGGSFILGPGNMSHFMHRDMCSMNHMAINDLLALAGVNQMNFEKDKRVLTV